MKKKAFAIEAISIALAILLLISGIVLSVALENWWVFIIQFSSCVLIVLLVTSFGTMMQQTDETLRLVRNLHDAAHKQPSVESTPAKAQTESRVVCPSCGTSQPGNRSVCYNCGAQLKK